MEQIFSDTLSLYVARNGSKLGKTSLRTGGSIRSFEDMHPNEAQGGEGEEHPQRPPGVTISQSGTFSETAGRNNKQSGTF